MHKDAKPSSLEDLRGKRVCMPEFGGIASIAFINTLKAQQLVNVKDCDFGKLLGEYFSDSCIPGSRDVLHDPKGVAAQSLCNLCRTTISAPIGPAVIENADVLPDERSLNEDEAVMEEPAADAPPAEDEHLTEQERELRSLRGSCAASTTNRYYGNQGSLQCLDEIGDVAILEAQYLNGNL